MLGVPPFSRAANIRWVKTTVKTRARTGIQETELDPCTRPAVCSKSAIGNALLLSRTPQREAEHFRDDLVFSN